MMNSYIFRKKNDKNIYIKCPQTFEYRDESAAENILN